MDSPAIQVTDDESEHPHTKGSNVQPQQQSSNNASRIQWDDSPAEATGATGGSHDSDQTALDPETLASLKQ